MPPKGELNCILCTSTRQLPPHLQKIHGKNEKTYLDSFSIASALDNYNCEPHRKVRDTNVDTEITQKMVTVNVSYMYFSSSRYNVSYSLSCVFLRYLVGVSILYSSSKNLYY